jgi:hypothetical protein
MALGGRSALIILQFEMETHSALLPPGVPGPKCLRNVAIDWPSKELKAKDLVNRTGFACRLHAVNVRTTADAGEPALIVLRPAGSTGQDAAGHAAAGGQTPEEATIAQGRIADLEAEDEAITPVDGGLLL